MSYTTKILMPLPVKDIYPHPDNPRKDIGDITELTSSIKKNGIMQNLTVIEGHHIAKEGWSNEGYTLLIGHRRFAAAKAAGLTEVPCKIVRDCDHKEQIAIMLEENMQRNDLTIYEQAQSFQLMLDLGETPQTLAQKTGFSESTIYHRVNLAKLDQTVLKEKEQDDSFQLTLKDMYELEKIKDIEKRNEILSSATNSENLRWKCINAAKEEKINENFSKLKKIFEDTGIENETSINPLWSGKFEKVMKISLEGDLPVLPALDPLEVTWFQGYGNTIYLLKEKPDEEEEDNSESDNRESPAAEPKEIVKSDEQVLDEMLTEVANEMVDFALNIRNIIPKSMLSKPELVAMCWKVMLDNGINDLDIKELTLLESDKERYYDITPEDVEAYKGRLLVMPVAEQMIKAIASNYCLDIDTVNCDGTYDDEPGEIIMRVYMLFEKLGFTPSKEEYIKVLNGTHELYKKEE